MTTRRKNLNRGYMQLEVWQRAMDLFEVIFKKSNVVLDFKLKSQITDSAQSVAANIAEGYGRRSLPEYIQYLYIAKGSLAECLTRSMGQLQVGIFTQKEFEEIDSLHYEVENKLINLIKSLEAKRNDDSWADSIPFSSNHKINQKTLSGSAITSTTILNDQFMPSDFKPSIHPIIH